MKLKDIKISKNFKKHLPSNKKVEAAMEYYQEYGKLDRPIVLNHNNVLIDGYARFKALEKLGLKEVDDSDENNFSWVETEYVFAHHPEDPNKKTYVWRLIRNGYEVLVNDMVPVRCWDGMSGYHNTYVVVDKIETLNYKPYNGKIKTCVIKGV